MNNISLKKKITWFGLFFLTFLVASQFHTRENYPAFIFLNSTF